MIPANELQHSFFLKEDDTKLLFSFYYFCYYFISHRINNSRPVKTIMNKPSKQGLEKLQKNEIFF